ncbi:MAG: hypothetical protein AAGI11_15225 [Pseudomonadota bacterium]
MNVYYELKVEGQPTDEEGNPTLQNTKIWRDSNVSLDGTLRILTWFKGRPVPDVIETQYDTDDAVKARLQSEVYTMPPTPQEIAQKMIDTATQARERFIYGGDFWTDSEGNAYAYGTHKDAAADMSSARLAAVEGKWKDGEIFPLYNESGEFEWRPMTSAEIISITDHAIDRRFMANGAHESVIQKAKAGESTDFAAELSAVIAQQAVLEA